MKKIEIVYTLKSPLSHIGESGSVTSFLNDVQIVNEDGLQEIFIYTANAFRGLWRDIGARQIVDKLGVQLDIESFHTLFSGGNIGGTQSADIDQARNIREKLPFLSLFGGGIGNQILEGQFKVGFGYPVCKETDQIIKVLPTTNMNLLNLSCGELTSDIEFTRMDDSKHELGELYLEDIAESGKKKKGQASTQMRYEVEYLVPGSQLYQEITLDCNEQEEGAFYSILKDFSSSPFIGGMSGKGFGKVDFTVYEDGKEKLSLNNDDLNMSDHAQSLIEIYERSLDELLLSGEQIKDIFGGAEKMSKKTTEPLKITAKMSDGRLNSADGWIFLDAILYHAWFLKHHPGIFDGTLPDNIDIGHIGLPLRQLDKHRYAASVGFYQQYGMQTEYWHKKPSAHGHLGQKYIDFGKRRGRVNASSGEYKAYRMPNVIRLVGDITFYAYGTKHKIKELLNLITHIGKKTSIGWGKVNEWIIESIDEDYTTICPYGLARPIEIDKADDDVKKHAHTIQDVAVRPAYWDYKNVETCFVPNPIIKE